MARNIYSLCIFAGVVSSLRDTPKHSLVVGFARSRWFPNHHRKLAGLPRLRTTHNFQALIFNRSFHSVTERTKLGPLWLFYKLAKPDSVSITVRPPVLNRALGEETSAIDRRFEHGVCQKLLLITYVRVRCHGSSVSEVIPNDLLLVSRKKTTFIPQVLRGVQELFIQIS